MAKYRRRVIEVEAHQWFVISPHPAVNYVPNEDVVFLWSHKTKTGEEKNLYWDEGFIDNAEAPHGGYIVAEGDYVVEDKKGGFYVVKPDLFEQKFEKVGD